MFYRRKTDNAQVADTEALDASGAIRDGYYLRTSTIMMDSAGLHRIHSVAINDGAYKLTDADELKVQQIDRHNARLSDAWRNPPNVVAHQTQHLRAPASPAPITDMDTVYDRNDKRLEDAWKMTA